MLMKISDATSIKVNDVFIRFIPNLINVYDKGMVTLVEDYTIEVDFGDTVVVYDRSLVTYVVNSDTQQEYFVSSVAGTILHDYRSASNPPPLKHEINSLEDLLDFDKWA